MKNGKKHTSHKQQEFLRRNEEKGKNIKDKCVEKDDCLFDQGRGIYASEVTKEPRCLQTKVQVFIMTRGLDTRQMSLTRYMKEMLKLENEIHFQG